MTNDQETILGQVSGSELSHNHQETIQLTELLPVEQSRIKDDNPDNRDQETTDGLRALRSFTRGQHQDFVTQREFDCFRKIERSNCETTTERGERLKKRKSNSIINSNSRVTTRSVTLENDGRRKIDIFPSAKRKNNSGDRYSGQWNNQEHQMESKYGKGDKKMEAEESLDSIDVEDEVYYYLQQQPDICETVDDEDDENDGNEDKDDENNTTTDTNLEILSAGVYRDMANNFSVGSSRAKECWNVGESSGKRRSKKGEKKRRIGNNDESKKEKKCEKNKRKDTSRKKKAEKNVGVEIKNGTLIEANNGPEGENNNVDSSSSSRECNGSGGNIKKSSEAQCETKKKKYCCVMCNSSFKGSGGLRNHYKVVHAAGPIYKCDECGKEFPLKERLKLHVRTHTGFKPYKCPDCHMSFARGGQLVQHRGTHSKIKPYNCSMCTGTFTCAANLALHVKRHNGQKDHKCEICGRGFVRKDALKKHLECLHRDVKSFLCVICNKTFKGHLPQHMRTHAQDRPHGCATCGQRFAQKSQLTVHQRTHSGQRPFRCLVCWQAFAHSTALKLHTRRHTGERPFKCAECNAGFTQLPHWKKHMKCIHGRSEPYSCKNCNSFFRIKNDLENHEKACHCDEIRTAAAVAATAAVGKLARINCPDDPASLGSPTNAGLSSDSPKFRSINVERMRLLLAVLLKRISKPERLDELGFGKRLIDEVLQDSLVSAGKVPSRIGEQLDELECLRNNLETFLEWTVPKEHWDKLRKINKTPEEILETLTAT